MFWILLALAVYFLLALVEITDKYILSLPSLHPLAYAFNVGLLVASIPFLWLFDFSWLSFSLTFLALLRGVLFFTAIFFFYTAIREGEISRAVSVVGGLSPLIIFVLSFIFLNEGLRLFYFFSFLMLIAGSILLSFARDHEEKIRFRKRFFFFSLAAAFFFALSFLLSKVVFLHTSFLNGFVWTHLGMSLSSFAVFMVPSFRKIIFEGARNFSRKITFIFLANKGASALTELGLNYAIMLGSVVIVNALQATEYAFIFILTLLISYFRPSILYESFSSGLLIMKIVGIALVSLGVIFLFV